MGASDSVVNPVFQWLVAFREGAGKKNSLMF